MRQQKLFFSLNKALKTEAGVTTGTLESRCRQDKPLEPRRQQVFSHAGLIQANPRIRQTLGASFGEGNGNPLQYSGLENPMDRGDWWATVHGVAKSQTRLSDFTFIFTFTFRGFPGEGNGIPLQYSCLENPRDGGAWWVARLWGHTELDTTEAT